VSTPRDERAGTICGVSQRTKAIEFRFKDPIAMVERLADANGRDRHDSR
jgi:hypothetical protein